MERDLKQILSGAGFYATLAICLAIVGVCGYFLLFDNKPDATPAPAEVPTPQQAVTAPAPEIVEEPDLPVVETVHLAPVQEEEAPAPMPEVEVDPTPVIAEAPRVIVAPLKGDVLAAFSMEELIYNETLGDWRTHDGVDIAAKPGSTVLAACSGTVHAVIDDALMGTTVILDHDGGYQTTYANLQKSPKVTEGASVSAGQIIGAVGSTAVVESAQPSHLHFSVTKDGKTMDPNEFLEG